MAHQGKPEFQRLSIVVRIFCALMAASSVLVVPFGVFAIQQYGLKFDYLMLMVAGPVAGLAFGYAAWTGRFPTRIPAVGAQHLYVRVSRDKLRVRSVESGIEVEVVPPLQFSSARLLVGNFEAAEWALKEGIKKAGLTGWYRPSPLILMHPLEMTEGGLSQIETRVLQELAIGAGARKVKVWTGPELSDAEVVERLGSERPA